MAPTTRAGLTAEQIREMVAAEVAQAIGDVIPDIVTSIRDQLDALISERVAATAAAGGQGRAREFQYRDFSACSPPEFKGVINPILSMRWIADVEGAFLTSGCPDNLKVRFVRNLLRGGAKDWWNTWTTGMTLAQVASITWEDFVNRFKAEYVPRVEMERIAREFMSLEQTTETIPELNRKFTEMALFCPQYAADEEMKMTRYLDMLRTEIREFVSTTQHPTLAALMEAARRREIELETQARKRKLSQSGPSVGPTAKKPRTGDIRPNQRSHGFRVSGGPAPKNDGKCFKCGQPGHLSRDCRVKLTVCYNCGKTGHVRPDCPDLKTGGGGGTANTPATPPLRIVEGRTGPTRPTVTRARVHQMTVEEAQTIPAVVSGIYDSAYVLS